MAYLIKRADSSFWWIKYRSKGKQKFQSTGHRHDDPNGTAAARKLQAEWTLAECSARAITGDQHWVAWVSKFIERHCDNPKTRRRYLGAWEWLHLYLQEHQIIAPAGFGYAKALGYIEWRTAFKKRAGRSVGRNTALLDLRVMRLIMQQAVRLGFATINPCDKLGISRTEPKQKPELTDQDIADAWAALQDEPEWMRRAFQMSLNTGCRLSETRIKTSDIDLTRGTITFAAPKGGQGRAFAVAIPAALRPLFSEIKASGEKTTLELPTMPGKAWWSFFKGKMKRNDLCFHCLRVTYITRLARAEVPRSVAMRMVNHSSTLVHSVYQRLGVEDVRAWADKVALPELHPGGTSEAKPSLPKE